MKWMVFLQTSLLPLMLQYGLVEHVGSLVDRCGGSPLI